MRKQRLIARLDIKNEFVIKGIHLEGLRKIGNPNTLALKYYEDGADEIIFMDAVASLYERNNLFHIIERACEEIFIPITIGGGIRSLSDIDKALKAGADKVALNTAAIRNPKIITEAVKSYGTQCIIGSIESKFKAGHWEAYIETGREETGKDVLEWAKQLQDLGVGEIMITSIDREGTKKGFEIPLIKKLSEIVKVPLIVSGGAGNKYHILECMQECNVDAVAIASALHYNMETITGIKEALKKEEIAVR